jgi:hypothetical protein
MAEVIATSVAEEDRCPTCLEPLWLGEAHTDSDADGSERLTPPCGHAGCRGCMSRYHSLVPELRRCPLCRADLVEWLDTVLGPAPPAYTQPPNLPWIGFVIIDCFDDIGGTKVVVKVWWNPTGFRVCLYRCDERDLAAEGPHIFTVSGWGALCDVLMGLFVCGANRLRNTTASRPPGTVGSGFAQLDMSLYAAGSAEPVVPHVFTATVDTDSPVSIENDLGPTLLCMRAALNSCGASWVLQGPRLLSSDGAESTDDAVRAVARAAGASGAAGASDHTPAEIVADQVSEVPAVVQMSLEL